MYNIHSRDKIKKKGTLEGPLSSGKRLLASFFGCDFFLLTACVAYRIDLRAGLVERGFF
jgi:hypothetical protein